MGTMYQIKAELIAAAIVTKYGKNSSCYDPQAWELCQKALLLKKGQGVPTASHSPNWDSNTLAD